MSHQERLTGIVATVGTSAAPKLGKRSAGRALEIRNILIIAVFSVLARASALFLSAIDWDEGVYIVMAQQWRQGYLPYVAVWDQHPPGLPALLAAVQALIPDPVFSARLLGTLAVAVTAGVIQLFGTRYLRRPKIGLAGALLYVVCISRFGGLALNTELINAAIVSTASYLLLTASEESVRGIWKATLAAMLLGIGLQVKYVVLPEALLTCIAYLVFIAARGIPIPNILGIGIILICAGVLPTLTAVAYFWSQGLLDAFLDANVRANVAYLSIGSDPVAMSWSAISGLSPLLGPILLIGYAWRGRMRSLSRRPSTRGFEIWIGIWIVAAILNICLPMKFFTHYFFGLYAPVCIGGMLALDRVMGKSRRSFVLGCVTLFLTAAPLWSAGMIRAARAHDIPRAFAALIRQAGASERSVYVYNYQPIIYALAGVRPPTPYVIHAELAQFSASANVSGPDEVDRIMKTAPRFLVVKSHVPGSEEDPLIDTLTPYLRQYDIVSDLSEANGEHVRLYRKSGLP